MRICKRCGLEKPDDAFELYKNGRYRRTKCRECRIVVQKEWYDKRRLNPPQKKPETKRCNTCHEVKPIGEFSPGNPGYFHGRCKVCTVEAHRKKRQEQYQNDPTMRFYWPFENEEGVIVKRCTCCHAEKPLSEFYMNGTHGRHGKCKDCDKELKKADYDAHPEKHRETVRKSMRKYPDRHRARFHRWQRANRERRLQYFRDHKDTRAEYTRIWAKTHPEKRAESWQRRRAHKLNAPRVEKIDRKAIIERDNWTCYLCKQICTPQSVSLDHVVPLSRGGSHAADNLRVACRICNCRKGARPLGEFLA